MIKNKSVPYIFKRIIIMGFKSAPVQFTVFLGMDVTNGILTGIMPLVMQKFFDSAVISKSFNIDLAVSMIFLGVVLISQHIINGIGHTVIPNLSNKMNGNAFLDLQKKTARIPPAMFEIQDFLNHLDKAYQGTSYGWNLLIPILRAIFLYTPYAIIMSIYLYSLKPVLAVCILIIYMPTIISYILKIRYYENYENEAAPVRRETEYYKECIITPEYHKETRILGAYNFFLSKYVKSLGTYIEKIWRINKKTNRIEFTANIITAVQYGAVLIILINSLLSGSIGAGAFASIFASIWYLFGMVDEGIGHFLMPLSNIPKIRNFIDYLELPERETVDKNINFKGDIKVNNISFKYDGAERNAVNNISFTINNGETLAVVGINGAGKTTLARLLLGLYIPDSGTITIGGEDISQASPKILHKGMSAIFQRFQKYKMSLKENVEISDTLCSKDDTEINISLRDSGLDVDNNAFPQNLDTMLSREFDGVDISGGQWQRVAIARGLFRNHDIIVLDEPTSAVDPIEERSLYEKFADVSKGKTSILITHRLGAARIADRIIVLDNGSIIEEGKHDDLMKRNGYYKNMFDAQMKWYE